MNGTLSRAEVREIDSRAVAEFGMTGLTLMENAGRGAAEVLMRLNPQRAPVLIACGPGNNGGDGFVMARHLDAAGWPVTLHVPAGDTISQADAIMNYHIALKSDLHCAPRIEGHRGWIVDALFGIGLQRPMQHPFQEAVEAINASAQPVLAVDLPSGLDCDTGEPYGLAVRATATVTFVAPKRGFVNPASYAYTGDVHVASIGAPRALLASYIT
jgi:NAD(P)H-hydrate epimerase